MDGNQVPQDLVSKVGETFESILKEACSLSLPPLSLSRRTFISVNFELLNIYSFFMEKNVCYMSLKYVGLWIFSDES